MGTAILLRPSEDLPAQGTPARGRQSPIATNRTTSQEGSGITPATVADHLAVTDGVIVGTSLKRHGIASESVDGARLRELMQAIRELRCTGM